VSVDFGAPEKGAGTVLVTSETPLREQVVYALSLASQNFGRLDHSQVGRLRVPTRRIEELLELANTRDEGHELLKRWDRHTDPC
jgi:hypothetical protein